MIFFKVPDVGVQMKYKASHFHSTEEKTIRTPSLGIQHDNEVPVKLTFTTFVGIIVSI